jgi:hypothetical protein
VAAAGPASWQRWGQECPRSFGSVDADGFGQAALRIVDAERVDGQLLDDLCGALECFIARHRRLVPSPRDVHAKGVIEWRDAHAVSVAIGHVDGVRIEGHADVVPVIRIPGYGGQY